MGVVLAPANGKGAARRLIDAGADEIYLGFHDKNWTNRFGNAADINRMSGFGDQANTLSFEEACEEIVSIRNAEKATPEQECGISEEQIAEDRIVQNDISEHDYGDSANVPDNTETKLFCTFNGAAYTSDQVDYIATYYLPMLADAGLTGIIVSSPQLIGAAHNVSLDVVASTMCAVYNEDIARFYCDCGVRRAILPRDLSLDDITDIIRAVPSLEYEAFLMRNGCVFADSNCLGLHRANCPSLCRSLRESPWWEIPLSYEGKPIDESYIGSRIASGSIHKDVFHLNTCGLCALWRLEQANVSAFKVVGRSDDVNDICRDVALVRQNIAIAQSCKTESDYLACMERPDGILALCANNGLSCYYPEARFD